MMILSTVAVVLMLAAAEGTDSYDPTQLYDPGNRVDEGGVVRDRTGRKIGRIEAESGGSHVLLDNEGRRVGTIEPGFNADELVIRDDAGRRQGTLGRQP